MKGWIAGLVLLLPMVTLAQDQQPLTHNDFAYGIPLEVDGDGALYSFELPAPVYRYCTRLDLGDMRIFNGYGEVVPHLTRPGVRQTALRQEPVSLHFFPLYESNEGKKGETRIHIATDEEGAVVDFWQQAPADEHEVIARYLIDASAVDKPVEKLLLRWDDTTETFLVPVEVEYSNDLASWQPLVTHATLASLRYEQFSLGQSAIDLPSVKAKYYRLSWPLGKKGIQLRELKAVVKQEGAAVLRQWLTLSPSGEATHNGVYDFNAHGHYPVDHVRIKLPQVNTVVRVKLYSRAAGAEAPWHQRYQGLVYHLLREGHALHSDIISLHGINDPRWRLEIETEGGGLGRGEPKLELGWVPHRVYFVARGETPFLLAFGAADIKASRSDLAPLLQTLKQTKKGNGFIKVARPGSYYELGGERRLKATPPPVPWKRWLLWGILVLGVVILALMARSLYRQMNDADRIN
jgi:hypothetical protein